VQRGTHTFVPQYVGTGAVEGRHTKPSEHSPIAPQRAYWHGMAMRGCVGGLAWVVSQRSPALHSESVAHAPPPVPPSELSPQPAPTNIAASDTNATSPVVDLSMSCSTANCTPTRAPLFAVVSGLAGGAEGTAWHESITPDRADDQRRARLQVLDKSDVTITLPAT
jgi:hypothetical protein